MKEVILLKYGEIVLKGLNRSYFDSLLLKRISSLLKEADGNFTLDYAQSTLCIRGGENADMDKAYALMKKVFGISTVCRGIECEKDMAAIKKALIENGAGFLQGAKTFKCVAKRSDKSFPLNSPQICAECGQIILENFDGISVDVINPEVNITIEIRDKCAFVHGGGEKARAVCPSGRTEKRYCCSPAVSTARSPDIWLPKEGYLSTRFISKVPRIPAKPQRKRWFRLPRN
jgi:thiamine biosynthesis protein ThiI